MPKIDGIEVLHRIKKDCKFQEIPVVIITTTDNPREMELCNNLGCIDYITKPVDYDRFINTFSNLECLK